MAQLDTGGGGGGGKHQKQRAKKQSTHIDMTPMVDLAFLLLTFFVLTSTFSKPVTMEITMPVKPKDKEDKTEVKHIVTLVVTKGDTVAWYYGKLDTASSAPFNVSTFSKDGIRKVLMENNKETIDKIREIEKKILSDKSMDEKARTELFKKQALELMAEKGAGSEKGALTVVIKTTDDAKYGRVVDMVDEMSIVNVGKYALVDISETELGFLQQQKIIK